MAGICFYFESNDIDVWSGRRIDFDAWNYAMKAAGDIDRVVVVNRTGVELVSPDVDLKGFDVVVGLADAFANKIITGQCAWVCCPWDNVISSSVWTYDHSCDWYIFGPANGWGNVGPSMRQDDIAISIPQANKAALHSVHIASAILLHRYMVLQ